MLYQTTDKELILSCQTNTTYWSPRRNAIMGGAGSGVNELLMQERCLVPVLNLGLPDLLCHKVDKRSEPIWDLMQQAFENRLKLSGHSFELIFQKSLLLVSRRDY